MVTPGQKIKIEKIDEPAEGPAESGREEGGLESVKALAGEESKLSSSPFAVAREGKESQEITFDEVLLLQKGNKSEIGTPFVNGAKVTGKILKQGKAKKVIAFKYKAKKRYKVKKGHRQPFTEVEITKIEML